VVHDRIIERLLNEFSGSVADDGRIMQWSAPTPSGDPLRVALTPKKGTGPVGLWVFDCRPRADSPIEYFSVTTEADLDALVARLRPRVQL
jgi:hypothetical protein